MQGDSVELARVAGGLQEIDLTDNLLASWSVLSELATGLPRLRCLNLSCNIMALPGDRLSANTALQILVLNNCCLTWAQVGLHPHTCLKHSAVQQMHVKSCTDATAQICVADCIPMTGSILCGIALLDMA